MALAGDIMSNIVPISDFGRGKASSTFERVTDSTPVVVVRHNVPTAVITTPAEYARLTEAEEDLYLLTEAIARMRRSGDKQATPLEDVMAEFGITDADLDDAGEVEFE